jgi:hypothetical protein
MAKKVTAKNIGKVLDNFKNHVESLEPDEKKQFANDLNSFLDELAGQDAFGTEGQCDPRGDQRN